MSDEGACGGGWGEAGRDGSDGLQREEEFADIRGQIDAKLTYEIMMWG